MKTIEPRILIYKALSSLSGEEVLVDMRNFKKEVTSTQQSALDFLKKAGLVSAKGKPKKLIRA